MQKSIAQTFVQRSALPLGVMHALGYNEGMAWDMIGHQWAVDLLQGHIRRGAVRHAYLFTGPEGVGRRTLALRFAQALVCEQPPAAGEACGQCRACRQIARQTYPDLHVVQREEGATVIKVEQIRALERALALTPHGPYRIALLRNFEEAHPSAANALLKTLEEPPGKVVLLLTAESAESLLPTVVSRCEVLRLRAVPTHTLSTALQTRHGLPAERADFLAHLSGGRPGYALRLHQNPDLLTARTEAIEALLNLLPADRIQRFAFAEKVSKARDDLRDLLTVWLSFWRDVLVLTSGAAVPTTHVDYHDTMQALASAVTADQALQLVQEITQALDDLDHFVNTRLVAENVMLSLPSTVIPQPSLP